VIWKLTPSSALPGTYPTLRVKIKCRSFLAAAFDLFDHQLGVEGGDQVPERFGPE